MTDKTDKTFNVLKYPDSYTWRDLDAARARGGIWPNGEPVRLSDPEMKPFIDQIKKGWGENPELAKNFLQNLSLHKPSET